MNDNKKIAINTLVIYGKICITSVISLLLSRLVLDALGSSDFGLYNVVGGIVVLLNVINSAMMSTTYRYIAYEIGKGEKGNPNRVFCTSIQIHICISIFLLLIGFTLGEWYIDNYLNVEPTKITDAHFVFRVSLLTTVISTIFVPFQGLQVAYEKFVVNSVIEILYHISKILLFVSLVYISDNKLRAYSIIMFVCTVGSCFLYMIYCVRKYKSVVRFRIYNDRSLIKEMFNYAFWTIFGAVGNIGKLQGCTIVLNYFFGTVVNAAYAVAHQVEGLVLMFARTLNQATVPQITKSYSGGDLDRAVSLTAYISKYTFILMGFISFPLMLELDFILSVWLKNIPEGATIFCKLILLSNLIGCLGEGVANMVYASGRIRAYQLIIHTTMLLGLPIAFFLFKQGYSPYYIGIVYCIINFVISILKIVLLKRVVDFDVKKLIKFSHIYIIYISIPLIIIYGIYDKFIETNSTLEHLLGLVGGILIYCIVVYIFGTDSNERSKMKRFIKNKCKMKV